MDYNPLIAQKQKEYQSLSDRLAEIEKMGQQFTGGELGDLSKMKRPEGMSVVDFYTPRMNAGKLSAIATSNARADQQAGMKALTELFGLQQSADTQADTQAATQKQRDIENAFNEKQLAQQKELALLKTGGSLGSLSVTAKKGLKDNLSALKDLKAMKDMFGSYQSGNTLRDLTTGITGPISGRFFPEYGKNGPLRTALSKLEANIRKEAYGSAFTETERKQSEFIPSMRKSETQNIQNLDNQIKSQINKIKASLSLEGYADDEIQSFIDSELGSEGLNEPDVNNDPLGLGL